MSISLVCIVLGFVAVTLIDLCEEFGKQKEDE